jgi:hypothetical protein
LKKKYFIYLFSFQSFDSSTNIDNSRHGGECALSAICHRFGDELQSKLPDLYNRTVIDIEQFNDGLFSFISNSRKRSSLILRIMSNTIDC